MKKLFLQKSQRKSILKSSLLRIYKKLNAKPKGTRTFILVKGIVYFSIQRAAVKLGESILPIYNENSKTSIIVITLL